MGLVSKTFVCLLGVVALILCGVLVWRWPRLAGRGTRHVGGRIALLGAAQLALLALVFATANKYFGFYSTWSDLLGTGSSAYTVTDQVLPGPAHSRADGHATADGAIGRSSTHGVVLREVIDGETSGLSVPVTVYLPPRYDQPGAAHRLPVVVALASRRASVPDPAALTAAISSHRLPPVVVVTVNPVVGGIACTDVPGGSQSETFLAQDLPAALETSLDVTSDPAGWGVMGEGVGGYCALKLAMRDSGTYTAAAALRLTQPAAPASAYGRSSAIRSENDLSWLIAHMPPPPVDLLIEPTLDSKARSKAGSKAGSASALAGFARRARAPLSVHAVAAGGCGAGLPGMLPWLVDRLSAPGIIAAPVTAPQARAGAPSRTTTVPPTKGTATKGMATKGMATTGTPTTGMATTGTKPTGTPTTGAPATGTKTKGTKTMKGTTRAGTTTLTTSGEGPALAGCVPAGSRRTIR